MSWLSKNFLTLSSNREGEKGERIKNSNSFLLIYSENIWLWNLKRVSAMHNSNLIWSDWLMIFASLLFLVETTSFPLLMEISMRKFLTTSKNIWRKRIAISWIKEWWTGRMLLGCFNTQSTKTSLLFGLKVIRTTGIRKAFPSKAMKRFRPSSTHI